MIQIIPAILPKSQFELDEKAKAVLGIADIVQIDVCDGNFVPNKTEFTKLPFTDEINYEFDLMISIIAAVQLDAYIAMKPKSIVLHTESIIEKPMMYIDQIKAAGIQVGLALSNGTENQAIEPYLSHVDFVQCMGIARVGFQGQPFDELVLDKIKDLRKNHPDLVISIDGAVNENTIKTLHNAGVNRFIVGSAVFDGDPKENIEKLKYLLQ